MRLELSLHTGFPATPENEISYPGYARVIVPSKSFRIVDDKSEESDFGIHLKQDVWFPTVTKTVLCDALVLGVFKDSSLFGYKLIAGGPLRLTVIDQVGVEAAQAEASCACLRNAACGEPNQPDGTFKCWACRNGY